MIEIASFVPIGFLLVLIAKRRRQTLPGPLMGLIIGAIAALFVEFSQIFIVSAVAQWSSVVTRAIGMAAGIWLGRAWNTAFVTRWIGIVPALLPIAGIVYLLALAAVVWPGRWQPDGALERLHAVNWLPFYYHYWTTEQVAVASLVFNGILYAPVGAAFWFLRFWESGGHSTDFSGAGRAAAAAALLALAVESSRLLKAGAHPDPTNILIGAIATALAFKALGWCAGCLLSDAAPEHVSRPPVRRSSR